MNVAKFGKVNFTFSQSRDGHSGETHHKEQFHGVQDLNPRPELILLRREEVGFYSKAMTCADDGSTVESYKSVTAMSQLWNFLKQ